jgi:MoaA/NifB/PqqE/SkfB family radical SAM enzyme
VYKQLTNTMARVLKTPPYLIVFVSDTCWMRCTHCWYSEEWKETNLTRAELSFDELEKLATSIPRLSFLSLTGGEAFRREEIVEIGTMFARQTRLARYQIPTSGFMPDLIVRRTEQLLAANPGIPFRVDVSLDGTEAMHESIRKAKGGFGRALETIRALNRIKEHCNYFDVGVITTVSRQNQDEVAAIASVVEKVHPQGEWMVNIARGKPRDPTAIDVDVEKYWQAHELIEGRIRDGRYHGHTGHFTASWLSAKNATRRKVIKDIVEGREPGGGCAAGALGGVIFNDGQVGACEMLERTIGNIRDYDYDLPRLWNSPDAIALRDWIQDTKCQCTQECFLSMSLLIQPRHWPKMVQERIKLWGAAH